MAGERNGHGLPVRPPQRGSSADRAAERDDLRGEDHGPIYKAIGRLETRVDEVERELAEHRIGSAADRKAIHQQISRHVGVLRTVQVRLNALLVAMASVALFALAGPAGIAELLAAVAGQAEGIGAEGVATLAGLAIPILYPLGRRIFLSVRPETRATQETDYGSEDHR